MTSDEATRAISARHDADYGVEDTFDARDVAAAIADGARFVAAMSGLLRDR